MNFAIRVKGSKIEHRVSADNIVNALNKFLSFGNYLAKDVRSIKERKEGYFNKEYLEE